MADTMSFFGRVCKYLSPLRKAQFWHFHPSHKAHKWDIFLDKDFSEGTHTLFFGFIPSFSVVLCVSSVALCVKKSGCCSIQTQRHRGTEFHRVIQFEMHPFLFWGK